MTQPIPENTDTPHFETDEVEVNLAIEQGLGIGARELAAQHDPREHTHGDDARIESDTDISKKEQLSSTNDA